MSIEEIEHELIGTCKDVPEIEGISQDDILHQIGERRNIERCEYCSWWFELCELSDFDGQLVCDGCK